MSNFLNQKGKYSMSEAKKEKLLKNQFTIWEGKVSISNNNLNKNGIIPVRLNKNKAVLLSEDADILCELSDDISQVIANFIKKDIFISAIITARPDKKNANVKIKIFAFCE